MGYQFFHIETYSEQAKPVKGSKDHFNSAAQVEGEAARDPIYSEQVDRPLPLQQVGGTLTIAEFRAKRARLLTDITETVTQKNGATYERGLRKDAATLYTEIHSHPLTSEEYLADRATHGPTIKAWAKRVIADFRKRMPKGVDFTALLHFDEGHIHVHILAMNTNDAKLDANKLHAGKVAAAVHRDENVSDAIQSLPMPELVARPKKPKKPRLSKNRVTQKKNNARYATAVAEWETSCAEIEAGNAVLTSEWEEVNKQHLKDARTKRGNPAVQKVYAAALKQLQDDYYDAVGKPCGLMRVGPRLARQSTKEYAADRQQAKRMADEAAKLDEQRADQDVKDAGLKGRAGKLQTAEAALAAREVAHQADVTAKSEALVNERTAWESTKAENQKANEKKGKKRWRKKKMNSSTERRN